MKLSHAAALALVGWYLMVPPITDGEKAIPPISQWGLDYSFDSAAACQAVLNARQENTAKTRKHECGISADFAGLMSAAKNTHDLDQLKHLQIATQQLGSVCIASDDPRLKEK
jgi:hypothetical protein